MTVNLFEKGKGLDYLREIYHLTDEQIGNIRQKIYYYDEPVSKSVGFTIQLGDEELYIPPIERKPSWKIVDDALEIFLAETGIYLDNYELSKIKLHCIHVSAGIDGGQSVRMHGLRPLGVLLETPSPISNFLAEHGIIVKPSEKWYSVNGTRRTLEHTMLSAKLDPHNGEVEAFVAGEYAKLREYSCVESNPEFLRELEQLCSTKLQRVWAARKSTLMYVSFDVTFDECRNIARMSCFKNPDNYHDILPYLKEQYPYGKEPQKVWRNYWLIFSCIENSCPNMIIERSPMAVNNSVILGPDRIVVTEVN